MTSITDTPQNPLPFNSARSRKVPGGRAIRWLRANLFASVTSSVISVLLIALLGKALVSLVQWGFWNAIWSVPGDQTGACRSIRGLGACWAVIPEKYRFILFGTYPFNEQWRPALVCLIFIALFYVSSRRSWWRKELVAVWAAALLLIGVLMWGGIAGLTYVSQDRWGGLPVTLILATFGLAFGFPLGIVVALGRRSKLPAIRSLCVLYVELIRGVPLISLLFMASVMFPLFIAGEHVHRLLQGYQPGADHRHLRSADDGEDVDHRSGLAAVQRRGLRVRGADLFRLLLRDVALQPRSGGAGKAGVTADRSQNGAISRSAGNEIHRRRRLMPP